jgi:hypothetical protein
MVPRTILHQLARLRWRERWLRLCWSGARWLAVLAAVLALACLTDWLIDLRRETPLGLRALLFLGQILLWSAALTVIAAQFARRPTDEELALYAEDQDPRFGHRLISAVQLNRPGAATQGMSPALIAAATNEAEQMAAATDFARFADHERLKKSAWVVAPVLVVAALAFALWPRTVQALLARQLLADREIPRSVHLASAKAEAVWPAGEANVLRFRVTGEGVAKDLHGELRIDPDNGLPSESYPLEFDSEDDGGAVFTARVPASSVHFSYRAWVKDGRLRQPARVRYEPRPAVQHQDAWVVMPANCGLRPNWQLQAALDALPALALTLKPPVALLAGQTYEEPQKGGDIVHRLPGSSGRVAVDFQKPVAEAAVELLGGAGEQEAIRQRQPLTLQGDGRHAEGVFDLTPGLTAYRVVAKDSYDFENVDRPRRGIRAGSVEPPEVALLPEHLWKAGDRGTAQDYEIEGIPALLGERIRIAYTAGHPYGLSKAQLRYRIVRKASSGLDDANGNPEGKWWTLPLASVSGSPELGPFDPRRGAFEHSGKDDQVEFHTVPSADWDRLSGTDGGGRLDFRTRIAVADRDGDPPRPLEVGDKIVYYVEVFDRGLDPDRVPGRSATREKEIVTPEGFLAWLNRKDEQKDRLRELEDRQRGVFGLTGTGRPDRKPLPPSPVPAPPTAGDRPTPPPVILTFGRSWQLLGPFANPNNVGLLRDYPPEKEKQADLDQEYDGLKDKARWRPHNSPTDKIDLEKFFAHGEAGVAYAVCWVNADGKRAAVLSTGSDDGIRVWLNRRLVLNKYTRRDAEPGDDKTKVNLADGWNEVLVKVDNRFGSWAFYLDLLDPDTDRRLEGLNVRLTPP